MSHKIFQMQFAKVYIALVQKAERKERTAAEVDIIICWLTSYTPQQLQEQLDMDVTVEQFYAAAPQINPNAHKITGVICGKRVEDIADPLMQNIQRLSKLIDELARGKSMDKILRT